LGRRGTHRRGRQAALSLAQSVSFERLHEQAYRDHGFELVDVPAGTVEERVELIDRQIRSWAE
jgi:predicted ATPase